MVRSGYQVQDTIHVTNISGLNGIVYEQLGYQAADTNSDRPMDALVEFKAST